MRRVRAIDARLKKSIAQGLKEAKAGRVYTHAEVFKSKRKK